jgi:hypothetical protein
MAGTMVGGELAGTMAGALTMVIGMATTTVLSMVIMPVCIMGLSTKTILIA